MDYQDVIYTKEEGIATITLNRPDKMNALIPGVSDGILEAVHDAIKDDNVRVLVITGSGRAFCSGADVKAMAQDTPPADSKKTEEKRTGTGVDRLALLFQGCDKPVIAAVNGVAVGAGLDLALACDIRIASDRARFGELFIRRGLVPSTGGTFFLPRLVGIDKACQLIWTGDMVDAREAERIGLVTTVVPHEELESATRELAEKLAKGPPLAIQRAKRVIYDGLGMDLESALDYIASLPKGAHETAENKEGAKAFVEKRAPVFKRT